MRTTLQITKQPIAEPVTVTIAKSHCRVDHDSDDALIATYIAVARTMAEQYLGRALITQNLLWTVMPEWPVRPSVHFLRHPLDLPRAPVQAISSPTAIPSTGIGVVVLDDRGNSTTIPPATLPIVPPATLQGYLADLALQPARLTIGLDTVLVDGRTIRQAPLQHMQVEFIAGYGVPASADQADAVPGLPQPIVQAILLTIAHLYEHRGDAGVDMPQSAQWLLDPYRIMWCG